MLVSDLQSRLKGSFKHLLDNSLPDPFALEKQLAKGVGKFFRSEIKNEGISNFANTLYQTVKKRDLVFSPDRTLGQELDVRAQRLGEKAHLSFKNKKYSYAHFNTEAAKVAGYLADNGIGEGASVGLLLPNLPAYLEIFYATQRVGACAVPTNTALIDDGLAYIINNAGMTVLFTVTDHLDELERIKDKIEAPLTIVVVPNVDETDFATNAKITKRLKKNNYPSYLEVVKAEPQPTPKSDISPDSTSMLMYTSGTTGHPKGVVYSYGTSQAKMIRMVAHLLVDANDIYYTCLPLFHANALLLTCFSCLYSDAEIALSSKFSARLFWQEIRESKATVFNTLGTMIAILMKQPINEIDGQHNVRRVISAACPAELWIEFEQRFNVKLTESFGAVDGGGISTMNVGNAPVGSIGKPMGGTKWRLVDDKGNDVPVGEPGELIHFVGTSDRGRVNYHNNEKASSEKTRDGWVYSGDLLRADKEGFLYFVGRNSDSMRCGGENVSAMQVESAINQFDTVLESAAFAVPSELAEDDIMVVVQPQEGKKVDPAELHIFVQSKLAKFALPKYIRVVDQLPKTETHRIIKHQLKKAGITSDTWVYTPKKK
ncbi:MAG: AMP-dependent synthetase [Moraxellaceae bacterium]|nr:MAG: AMP-dependent synthetase [Moraxellaceae bacterium]